MRMVIHRNHKAVFHFFSRLKRLQGQQTANVRMPIFCHDFQFKTDLMRLTAKHQFHRLIGLDQVPEILTAQNHCTNSKSAQSSVGKMLNKSNCANAWINRKVWKMPFKAFQLRTQTPKHNLTLHILRLLCRIPQARSSAERVILNTVYSASIVHFVAFGLRTATAAESQYFPVSVAIVFFSCAVKAALPFSMSSPLASFGQYSHHRQNLTLFFFMN